MSRKGRSSRGGGNRGFAPIDLLDQGVFASPEQCYSTFHFHFAKSEHSWWPSLLENLSNT